MLKGEISKIPSGNKILIKPNKLYLSFSDAVIGKWGYFNDHDG